jgi:tetratricopeptide (TPR) repeat protein
MKTAAPIFGFQASGVVTCARLACIAFLVGTLAASPVFGALPELPADARKGLARLYDGETDRAIAHFRRLQQREPEHPLGYLLEANALWWRIYCEACEFRWNLVDAWKRAPQNDDRVYFALADRAIALAEARLGESHTAEMHLYAGMGYALKARLYGLADERRATVRAGVRAREHFLKARALDPSLADADTGLGLYNYYVDTLSPLVRMIRFFLRIPSGDKAEGVRQLERAMGEGEITAVEARFYLAKNLRNYDEQYARAIEVLMPLVVRHPRNPLFHLILGDLHRKLGHWREAAESFRAVIELAENDTTACSSRLASLARTTLDTLPGEAGEPAAPAPR